MGKHILYNPATDERTIVESDEVIYDNMSLDEVKSMKLDRLLDSYGALLLGGFVSSATGTPIPYSYSKESQFIYSKWANVLALNPAKDTVFFDSISNERIIMTRAQFLSFLDDAEEHEVQLYTRLKDLEATVAAATTKDEVLSIEY